MNTEELIISGIISGSDPAYKYLYDNYYRQLCVFANCYVNDMPMAEMLVGDVIYHIWETRQRLEIKSSLRNFLLTSVKNRCLNHINQLSRQETHKTELLEILKSRENDYESQKNYPLAELLEKELEGKIEESLASMPSLTRKIFEMSRYSNLTYPEIAEKAEVSVDTVKYHMKSALARLRKDLREYEFLLILVHSLFFF